MANFEAFTFFLGPTLSAMRGHFNCVDAAPGSALPPTLSTSSTSCPYEDVAWSSSSFVVASSAACATAAASASFSYFAAFCVASCTALSLVDVVSFCLFSANYVTCNLASSFFFCVVSFSILARSGARHSGGHVSKIVKMVSSVAIKGSFIHCFIVSLCALMYILCVSTLNSAKLYRLLYTVGDRHNL